MGFNSGFKGLRQLGATQRQRPVHPKTGQEVPEREQTYPSYIQGSTK